MCTRLVPLLLLGAALAVGCAGAAPVAAAAGAPARDDAALRATTLEALGALTRAASAFELQNGRCAQSVDELVAPDPAPRDAWGHALAFMPASDESPRSAFVSAGPDGELLTADDIALASPCATR